MSVLRRVVWRAARTTTTRMPPGMRELALGLAARVVDGPALLPGPPPGPVLMIAPHPDDETIGAGGALARHVQAGDRVTVLVATSGEATSGGGGNVAANREAECRAACADLGVAAPVFARLPDGALSGAVLALAHAITAHGADAATVYVPSPLDPHADHRAANVALARAGLAATIYGYEVWSPAPVDVLLDVSGVYDRKARALGRYATALETVDYVRAAAGLAAYRSMGGGLGGVGMAEGFVCMDAATHAHLVDPVVDPAGGEA